MNIIQPGQKLTARSIGNYDCIYEAEVIARKNNFVTVRTRMDGERRVKVFADSDGEYIYAFGRYSMAPRFRAPKTQKMKHIAITCTNRSHVGGPSTFILHTATSCHQVEGVALRFDHDNFAQGITIAEQLRESLNAAIDAGIVILLRQPKGQEEHA